MSGAIATNSQGFVSSPVFRQPPSSPLSVRHTSPKPSSPVSSMQKHANKFVDSNATPSVLSKRKRPARIQIPIAQVSFTNEVVKKDDDVVEIEEHGEEYAVYCKKGKRGAMEDRFSVVLNLVGDSKQVSFRQFF